MANIAHESPSVNTELAAKDWREVTTRKCRYLKRATRFGTFAVRTNVKTKKCIVLLPDGNEFRAKSQEVAIADLNRIIDRQEQQA